MEGWGVLEQAGELNRRGEPFALATVVWRQGPSSGQQGSRAIITAAGELRGWIGGACAEPTVIREARQVITEGKPRLLLLGSPELPGAAQTAGDARDARDAGETRDTRDPGDARDAGSAQPVTTAPLRGAVLEGVSVVPISCQSEGALQVYIEPVLPAPHLVVVGSSPMAHTLADLGRALGWRAVLVDGTDFSADHADERSMVVVATQGHHDEEAVEQAVAARPAYIGLVGSQRRGAALLGYLAERGVPKDQLERVRVPAGLDLGKTTHQEIAVAILAELVQLRAAGALETTDRGKASGSKARTPGKASPRHPAAHDADAQHYAAQHPAAQHPAAQHPATQHPAAEHPAEAVDPVCGMTVAAGPSSRGASGHPLCRDGVTYYFCSAGCRSAFEKDPAAYVKKETRC
jgi:xanthine dehydrogenase accessory factor